MRSDRFELMYQRADQRSSPNESDHVMVAMMKMKKLDVKALQAAYDG